MALKPQMSGVGITSGKADFVRRIIPDIREKYGAESIKYIEHEILKKVKKLKPKNKIEFNKIYNQCIEKFSEPVCLCDSNMDGSKGCPSNKVPANFVFDDWKEMHIGCGGDSRLVEIIKGMNLHAGEVAPAKCRCFYCSARDKNGENPSPTKLNADNFERYIKKYNVPLIRLGKSSDYGHPMCRENLLKILEIGTKNDVIFIFTTKFLEYDERVVKWLRKGSALHISSGGDVFEPGPCLHGRNNAKRVETANEYLESGVNTCIKLLTDFTISPEEAYELGWQTPYVLSNFPKERIELIPLRLESRERALMLTGETWDELLFNRKGNDLFEKKDSDGARYVRESGGRIIPRKIHAAYSEFVENKQICGHFGSHKEGFVYCDMCHLSKKRIKFPLYELPPAPKSTMPRKPQDYAKEKSEREFRKYHMKLDFNKIDKLDVLNNLVGVLKEVIKEKCQHQN